MSACASCVLREDGKGGSTGSRQAEDSRHGLLAWRIHLSSILFGCIMVPNIESDYILLLGYSIYIRNIILLGLTTKKNTAHLGVSWIGFKTFLTYP